jgi:hypothetical protein
MLNCPRKADRLKLTSKDVLAKRLEKFRDENDGIRLVPWSKKSGIEIDVENHIRRINKWGKERES